jgi:MFS family permease
LLEAHILDGSDNMNTAISSRDERAFSAPALLVAGAFYGVSRRDGDRHRPARYGERFWRHRGRAEYRHQRLSDYPGGTDPGQRLDRRSLRRPRYFTLALAIFTLASVFCGLSTEVHTFVAMRILQGSEAR